MTEYKRSMTVEDLADLRSWRETERQQWLELERDIVTFSRYAVAAADTLLKGQDTTASVMSLDQQRARCLQSQAVWAETCERLARAASEYHPH